MVEQTGAGVELMGDRNGEHSGRHWQFEGLACSKYHLGYEVADGLFLFDGESP